MSSLKSLIEKELERGISQRHLAVSIGVSQGTISNIRAGAIPTKVAILARFATYFRVSIENLVSKKDREKLPSSVAEPIARYKLAASSRLLQLAERLDADELAALERCAEALASGNPEVRNHLIGQLKLIDHYVRIVPPSRGRSSTRKGGEAR